jgi:dTDP-4-dehydrorhamnose reductase
MKIVIIGSGGRLGAALSRAYQKSHEVVGFTHARIDLNDLNEVEQVISPLGFDLLINCAALTDVDLCEHQDDRAFRINADAPGLLARICAVKNAKLIHFSTDYVFDGEKRSPYGEEDDASPISIYGESKREGEERVLAQHARHLVVRVSWVFGPDRPSFVDNIIQRACEQEQVEAIADKFSTPTYTADIAAMLPRFFESEEGGLLHFANSGECSWQEYAQYALDRCMEIGLRLKTNTVAPLTLNEMKGFIANRPPYTVLSTEKYAGLAGRPPRPWRKAVAEYIREFYSPGRTPVAQPGT